MLLVIQIALRFLIGLNVFSAEFIKLGFDFWIVNISFINVLICQLDSLRTLKVA